MPSALPSDLKAELEARNRAFENDDIEWCKKRMPVPSDPRVYEMAFHKARYECVAVSARKRRESQNWLIINHVKRMGGEFVVPGEPLPK